MNMLMQNLSEWIKHFFHCLNLKRGKHENEMPRTDLDNDHYLFLLPSDRIRAKRFAYSFLNQPR